MQERQVAPQKQGTRIPQAVPNCDLRQFPLSPLEAYVYSRVDGTMNEASLVLCVGMESDVVIAALERLAAFGAIHFTEGAAKTGSSQLRSRASNDTSSSSTEFLGDNPRRSDVVVKATASKPSVGPGGLTPVPAPRVSASPGAGSRHPAPHRDPTAPITDRPARSATPVPSTYRPPSAHPDALRQVQRYLDSARVAIAEGNGTAAANFYRLAQELAPHDPAIRVAIEECSRMAADTRALAERASILVRRGDAAARDQRWAEAASQYKEAALERPNDAAVLYKAAGSLHRCHDYRAAADFATRAAAVAPNRVEIWILLAYINLATGAAAEARQALAEAQRVSPDDERVVHLAAKIEP